MKRCLAPARPNWQTIVTNDGVPYYQTAHDDGRRPTPYWVDGLYYEFTLDEIARIEAAAIELYKLFDDTGKLVVESEDMLRRLHIPEQCWTAVRQSWWGEPPYVTARFDLAYNPLTGAIKLLEFNAQTPTSLPESAIAQWHWLEDMKAMHPERFPAHTDQFNDIWDGLIRAWQRQVPANATIHFACLSSEDIEDNGEDLCNTTVLMEAAQKAGYKTSLMWMQDITWHEEEQALADPDGNIITHLFMLYPYEWVFLGKEEIAQYILQLTDPNDRKMPRPQGFVMPTNAVQFINPLYTMVWSNKGILPMLWEQFENHELLLPAYFDDPHGMLDYVEKPLLSREGANVTIYRDGQAVETLGGEYGEEGYVYQQYVDLYGHGSDGGSDLFFPILGVWVADGDVVGMGIRESMSRITNNSSRFASHVIV